ncbi:MAG: hypothetical protein K9I71_01405 [Ignavibacteriales bacterium]|nr:hypothetical protein [Ignavibacteriales bacterium]MCF8314745.1 hypothetical protein [Ignavibacteriales bacterium]MCF8438007.1 hypothetical protein [Ignavibacteriales bacterium]
MEKLIKNAKTSAAITTILGILALTWIVIDYFVLKDILTQITEGMYFEKTLLTIGGIVLILFVFLVFIQTYYILRMSGKLANKDENKRTEE